MAGLGRRVQIHYVPIESQSHFCEFRPPTQMYGDYAGLVTTNSFNPSRSPEGEGRGRYKSMPVLA